MKNLVAFVLGLPVGVALLALGIYYNPFIAAVSVSPLAVSSDAQINLGFSAVPAEALLFTNDGESVPPPHPTDAVELWDLTLRNSEIAVVEVTNAIGESIGVGVKFSSDSEATQPLESKVLVDSAWHIFLPSRGTLFIGQRENHWSFLREVIVQSEINSADSWRGKWNGVMTVGPNALGTGLVSGGSGEFAGLDSEAVESLNATAYSADYGPVAIDGNLVISIPADDALRTASQE